MNAFELRPPGYRKGHICEDSFAVYDSYSSKDRLLLASRTLYALPTVHCHSAHIHARVNPFTVYNHLSFVLLFSLFAPSTSSIHNNLFSTSGSRTLGIFNLSIHCACLSFSVYISTNPKFQGINVQHIEDSDAWDICIFSKPTGGPASHAWAIAAA